MELDARRIPDGTALHADLCIIGAGPAGITLAREFVGWKGRVLLLESGGLEPEEKIQALNEGAVIGGRYAGLRQTRYRGVGGTANLWSTPVGGEIGAKYVPLDPYDFEEQAEAPHDRWPFDYSYLEPFYRRAHALCGLGPFAYEGEYWSDGERPCFTLDRELITTKVYQFGAGSLFTQSYPGDVLKSYNVNLCHHATVCGLETLGSDIQVAAAKVSSLSKCQFRVRASIFVLAAGAIENARLLLSGGNGSNALGNRHGQVGRCFMEHLRDYALTLIPRSPELFNKAVFYDAHAARDGSVVGGRIALTRQAVRRANLPNASITLYPRKKTWPSSTGVTRRVVARMRRFAGRRAIMGSGWSRVPDLSRVCDAFQLLINLEQRPDPENRVVLGSMRDSLGVQRAELRWRWRREEQAALERLRALVAAELQVAGLGRVEVRAGFRPDPNSHHQAGTTRMHQDPRYGVVNGDGRVHGTDNLYATGGSVFPSAGFANPTLTIVALALRLADHLKQRM